MGVAAALFVVDNVLMMRSSIFAVAASVAALVGCDLLTPPEILGGGERRPTEGEGDVAEGEGDVAEGEGDVVAEGEGDVVAEGEGDVVVGCTTITSGPSELTAEADPGTEVARIDGALASPSFQFSLQLYGPHTPGTFDLSASINSDFSTCSECVLAFAGAKTFFQTSGTVVLDSEPLVDNQMTGSAIGVHLIEVTIDAATFVATPVAGGDCVDLTSWNFNVAAPAPPP